MSQTFTLRPAAPGDEARLSAFFRALTPEALTQFTPFPPSPGRIAAAVRTPGVLLGVTPEGEVAGCAVLGEFEHAVPTVSLAVARPCEGNGHALLAMVKDWARDAGKQALRASIDRMGLRAQWLFRSAGFTGLGFTLDGRILMVGGLQPSDRDIRRLPSAEQTVTLRDGTPAVLRSLRPDDGEALLRFFADMDDIGRYYYVPHPTDRESLETICREADSRQDYDRFVLEAEHDGTPRIGGYVFLSLLQSPLPSMGIGAAAWVQGNGAGRAMLSFIQDRARAYGRHAMRLCTHTSNFRAQKLYKTAGFEIFGMATNGEYLLLCDLDRA